MRKVAVCFAVVAVATSAVAQDAMDFAETPSQTINVPLHTTVQPDWPEIANLPDRSAVLEVISRLQSQYSGIDSERLSCGIFCEHRVERGTTCGLKCGGTFLRGTVDVTDDQAQKQVSALNDLAVAAESANEAGVDDVERFGFFTGACRLWKPPDTNVNCFAPWTEQQCSIAAKSSKSFHTFVLFGTC